MASDELARAARMRGRGWLTALAAVAVLATTGGWVAGQWMLSPREVAANSEPPPATIITAEVVLTTLEQTVVSRGRIDAVDVVKVGRGRLIPDADGAGEEPGAEDGVLTDVFVALGDEVRPGMPVVEIDGRPTIVLEGTKATYRDMKPRMSGTDVEQLQRALAELGFFDGKVTGFFGDKTKDAVARLYADLGYPAPTTDGGDGSDEAAIQAARDALDEATVALAQAEEQRTKARATHQAQLDQWRTARAQDPATAGQKPTYEGPSSADVARAKDAVSRARKAWEREIAQRGAMAPRSEIVFVPRLPASVTQLGTYTGYAPSAPLFTLTPSAMVLTTEVTKAQSGLLQVGAEAEVDLPEVGTVTGTIASISDAPSAGMMRVEISTPEPLPFALQGADVKVTFLAAATAGDVLAVPQGALSSDAGGRLSVIVQGADGILTRVPVEVGVAGDGLVEVTPAEDGALAAGTKVVIGG
ncbi:MAG: peptidoglycan-binding protein [Arachnia sp.]